MDHFKTAWPVVKENLVGWVILGAVFSVLASFGVGIFLLPNLFRASAKAIEQNTAPDMADLFNFDNIGDDIVAMLLYGAAQFVGSLLCGVGAIVTGVLFIWVPMLAARGHFAPVEAMKASLAHAKGNFAPIIIFLIISSVINSVAVFLCVIPVFVTLPVTIVAMWQFFGAEESNIHQAAAAESIPTKA